MTGTMPQGPSRSPETLDPVGQRLLPILRHFLRALQEGGSGAWQIGFAAAAEVWGEARGLAIAFRAQKFLAALLKSRPVPLRHADPLCPEARLTITEDEAVLLALLAQMRNDEPRRARDSIAALTGGRVEAAVVRTGLELCAILDGTPGARRGQAARPLSVVR
ncbi:MAG: hypothetical protein ACOCYW_04465 [Roseicyclus sp.]